MLFSLEWGWRTNIGEGEVLEMEVRVRKDISWWVLKPMKVLIWCLFVQTVIALHLLWYPFYLPYPFCPKISVVEACVPESWMLHPRESVPIVGTYHTQLTLRPTAYSLNQLVLE